MVVSERHLAAAPDQASHPELETPRRMGPPPSEARFKSSPPSHLQRNPSVTLPLHRAHPPVVGGGVSLTYQPTPLSPAHNLPTAPQCPGRKSTHEAGLSNLSQTALCLS